MCVCAAQLRVSHVSCRRDQLNEVDKVNQGHVLVQSCEELFEREREAWLSTSMTSMTERIGESSEGGTNEPLP